MIATWSSSVRQRNIEMADGYAGMTVVQGILASKNGTYKHCKQHQNYEIYHP